VTLLFFWPVRCRLFASCQRRFFFFPPLCASNLRNFVPDFCPFPAHAANLLLSPPGLPEMDPFLRRKRAVSSSSSLAVICFFRLVVPPLLNMDSFFPRQRAIFSFCKSIRPFIASESQSSLLFRKVLPKSSPDMLSFPTEVEPVLRNGFFFSIIRTPFSVDALRLNSLNRLTGASLTKVFFLQVPRTVFLQSESFLRDFANFRLAR